MRVLVCGGRDHDDRAQVFRVLGWLHERHRLSTLIEGGAPGADSLAREWAESYGVPVETYRANWRDGRRAGPERNTRMLREGHPGLVVAFRGGRGTANMLAQARARGVRVVEQPAS